MFHSASRRMVCWAPPLPGIPDPPNPCNSGNFKDSTSAFQPAFRHPCGTIRCEPSPGVHAPLSSVIKRYQPFTMPFTIRSRSVHAKKPDFHDRSRSFTIVHAKKKSPAGIWTIAPAQAASSCSSGPSRLISTCERSQSVRIKNAQFSQLFALVRTKNKKIQSTRRSPLFLPSSSRSSRFKKALALFPSPC